MIHYWQTNNLIRDRIYIPKYYDPTIEKKLDLLASTHDLFIIQQLVDSNVLEVSTGHEIGKLAYGTGNIPFVRTSDISNWEIKSTPKQGVSEEIYSKYAESQDVRIGDILLVRDGTYLIGTNCIITALDRKMLYQSHILKFRVKDKHQLDPYLLFLSLNTDIVQEQIRSVQFTADTIDTIGNRYLEITLPVPKDKREKRKLSTKVQGFLDVRERGKAFIKHCPVLMEKMLSTNDVGVFTEFMSKDWEDILSELNQETVTSEFGSFETFWFSSEKIKNRIFLPKYYDPDIAVELKKLKNTCELLSIRDLQEQNIIQCTTGDEVGKMAYGTGDIPFIRTSDFANWEIKYDPKQGISEDIYYQYAESEDIKPEDILLVRDGTYLVGSSCIITKDDIKVLFCGGLYKIRVLDAEKLNPWLLLGLLNSYIVKRQIRTKQFTRDVIDTLGRRLQEVILPIPLSSAVRNEITEKVKSVIKVRITAREGIKKLVLSMIAP